MTDIGVLTYHNNENRGAVLQAYCLWKALRDSVPGSAVEVVDYRTRSREFHRIVALDPRELRRRIADYSTCFDFLREHGALSADRIVTDDHRKAISFLREQDYDVIVVGSDEVWKTGPKSGLLPSRPFPNAYLLDPSLDALGVSYAASANTVELSSLSTDQRRTLKRHLSAFDRISVRDRHTESLLAALGITDVVRVPDPTLLVDLPRPDVTDALTAAGVDLDQPILGVHGEETAPFEPILDHYRRRGYQIVTPTLSSRADVELFGTLAPFEYYSLYQHFDLVVTSSLHSTIFSLKSETPFVTIDVSPAYASVESKTHSLLEDLSLLDRHVDGVGGLPPDAVEQVVACEQPLDREHVAEALDAQRERGYAYLDELNSLVQRTAIGEVGG